MSIFHFSSQAISRKVGRSSVACASYRAGENIQDLRTGEVHDFTRKSGVVGAIIFLPGGGTINRSELWNAVEKHHKRGDAVVAREFEVSLPKELNFDQRQELAFGYAKELANKYKVAVDVCLHGPKTVTDAMLEKNPDMYWEQDPPDPKTGKPGRRHNGNWHMHILMSACYVLADGTLGKKCVEFDPIHCQRAKIENAMDIQRPRWQDVCNAALAKAGSKERIDHRSFVDRGINDRLPGFHRGPAVSEIIDHGGVSEIAERETKKLAEFMAQVQADAAIEMARQSAIAEVARIELELLKALAQVAAEETVTPTVAPVVSVPFLSAAELEMLRKQRVDESHTLHDLVVELNNKRFTAKRFDEINLAKGDLTFLLKELEVCSVEIVQLDRSILKVNKRFGGLAESFFDFLVPGRAKLQASIAAKREAAEKIRQRIQKVEMVAKAADIANIDQQLMQAKRRQSQVLAEVQDIDSDLAYLQRNLSKPKPVQQVQSELKLVRERDLDLSR